jgi:YbbR domain-containing protein
MNKVNIVAVPTCLICVVALAGSLLSLAGCNRAPETEDAAKADASPKEKAPAADSAVIQVSFKMDSRITRGLYMGDRWISPPKYTITSAQEAIESKAYRIDGKGKSMKISPQWIPADTEMVAVSPAEGHEVKISVKRAGESTLKVTSDGVSKELSIKAVERGKTIRVEIEQP